MNATRTSRRRLALVAGFALATATAFCGIQVAAADAPIGSRDADARADVGRSTYYASQGSAPANMVLTRANLDTNAGYGRSSVYAAGWAHGGTIIGAADPGGAVFARPDPTRPGRQ
jgi:hypothetical protein